MRPFDAIAVELALLQAGVFARWQLRGRGVPDDAIKARLRSGIWTQVVPGVYRLPGAAESFVQRAWVGWLAVGPGAVVSHEAAAQLSGVPNVVRNRVTLIAPHGWHHRVPAVKVYQLDDVLTDHRTSCDGP
jgi:hypothetical protein